MLTRRRFIKNSCALGVAASAAPLVTASTASDLSGYRALVCVYLGGGNDSYNMLVPTDSDQYSEYQKARGSLALNINDLLKLPGLSNEGRSHSLHPSMAALHEMYASGDAAYIANVGSLSNKFDAGASLHSKLLTHSAQLNQWQTSFPGQAQTSGWAGRMADVLPNSSYKNNLPINLTTSGANLFQLGSRTTPYNLDVDYSIRRSNQKTPIGVDFDFVNEKMVVQALREGRPGFSHRAAQRKQSEEKETKFEIENAYKQVPNLKSKFPDNAFSQRLAEVARIITARDILKSQRQVFYVSFNGWDHHHNLLSDHASMLETLSRGLSSFRDVLKEAGAFNDVTTFTTSEFGRSLSSNGTGSDHGWGGHQIVMGGSIDGGKIYGEYPKLSLINPLNVGNGVYAPTTSNDEYFSGLALWLGTPESKINYVLPNLRKFQSVTAETSSLKFLS